VLLLRSTLVTVYTTHRVQFFHWGPALLPCPCHTPAAKCVRKWPARDQCHVTLDVMHVEFRFDTNLCHVVASGLPVSAPATVIVIIIAVAPTPSIVAAALVVAGRVVLER
jgi:hypothetical protein